MATDIDPEDYRYEPNLERIRIHDETAARQGHRCLDCGRVVGTSRVDPAMLHGYPATSLEPEPFILCYTCSREGRPRRAQPASGR